VYVSMTIRIHLSLKRGHQAILKHNARFIAEGDINDASVLKKFF